jgi:hypothetical protein
MVEDSTEHDLFNSIREQILDDNAHYALHPNRMSWADWMKWTPATAAEIEEKHELIQPHFLGYFWPGPSQKP